MNDTNIQKKTLIQSLKPFFTRRVFVLILLGLSSGLPLVLIFDTLSIWLRDEGLSLATIGYFSLATFSYSLKFVWAPLMDRVPIPFLTKILGQRRAWIIICQAIIVLGLWVISGLDPQKSLGLMAALAVLTGFAGATQDIVIDAYRIEIAGDTQEGQAIFATAHAWGYRVATFLSGIVPLYVAKLYNWHLAYAVMASLMALGVIATILAPKGPAHQVRLIDYGDLVKRPVFEAIEWLGRLLIIYCAIVLMGSGLTANLTLANPFFQLFGLSKEAIEGVTKIFTSKEVGIFIQFPCVILGLLVMIGACLPFPKMLTRPGAYLRQSFVAPMADFFTRHRQMAYLILAMICFYRISDNLLNINGAFYRDLGFDLTVIANVRKIYGVIMTIIGVSLGGFSLVRFGMKFSLVFGAVVGAVSNLFYAWLATKGADLGAFSITLAADNISGGIAGTVLIAYMSSLISPQFAAPQYALLSSIYVLPGKLLASQSGRIVETLALGADKGGMASSLLSSMSGLGADAYVKPAQTLGVSAAALGSAYGVFFIYTTVIGILSVLLAFWLIARQEKINDKSE